MNMQSMHKELTDATNKAIESVCEKRSRQYKSLNVVYDPEVKPNGHQSTTMNERKESWESFFPRQSEIDHYVRIYAQDAAKQIVDQKIDEAIMDAIWSPSEDKDRIDIAVNAVKLYVMFQEDRLLIAA